MIVVFKNSFKGFLPVRTRSLDVKPRTDLTWRKGRRFVLAIYLTIFGVFSDGGAIENANQVFQPDDRF